MLERVNLVPGYRRYLEWKTGVKMDGTACYLCGRVRYATGKDEAGRGWPFVVANLHMDHLIPLESDAATPDSPWAKVVVVVADSDFAADLGPRSKAAWEVREIDAPHNFAPICTQCNNLKGGRSCERFPSAAEQAAVAAFHIAKNAKNVALFQGKVGPVLGDMPEALAAKYRIKKTGDYHAGSVDKRLQKPDPKPE